MINIPANASPESKKIFYLYNQQLTKLDREFQEAEILQGAAQDIEAYKAQLLRCKSMLIASLVLLNRHLEQAQPDFAGFNQQMSTIANQIAPAAAEARTLRGRLHPLPLPEDGIDSDSDG
ncbi:MAG: hypothetical protein JSR58_03755 [Verrucomicrobia bacterium]|nr:hypothetical protein [Verrucomicrobiota bacterium]